MDKELIDCIKNSSELIKIIYEDGAQPAVRNVGKALGTIFDKPNIWLLPMWLNNEKAKAIFMRNLEKFKESLYKEDEEEIVEVIPEIGVPILNKLSYIQNEDIAAMFVNLLVTASIKTTEGNAHPSFVNIISNLSSDEAKILNAIKTDLFIQRLYPFIDVVTVIGKDQWIKTGAYLTSIEHEMDLLFPENISLYLENLISLGLLFPNEYGISDTKIYEYIVERYKKEYDLDREDRKIIRRSFEVTYKCKRFMSACISKDVADAS
jgi:hypothetical protein